MIQLGDEDAFTLDDLTVTIKNQNGDEIDLTAAHPVFTILDTEGADATTVETYTPADATFETDSTEPDYLILLARFTMLT